MMHRLLLFFLVACLSASAFASPWLRGRDDRPIEPVDIPPSIQSGIDMIYVDPELAPEVRERGDVMAELGFGEGPPAPLDLFRPMSPFYTALRRGFHDYRATWGKLPQLELPRGPVLKPGDVGERVALLRERLGLAPEDSYDGALAEAVRHYQRVHGLKADGIAGDATIASLNLGTDHYEHLLMINLDRARTLPPSDAEGRYILVDAGAARLTMFEEGRAVDSMKVIVGKPASATPMMAALIRYASVNPYWNVPIDLAQTLIAPKVLSDGLRHIEEERYQVLSGFGADAVPVDPAGIDWRAVADGSLEIRVRQLPGRGNSMGAIKFMMPNDYGIYLHDTNDKALFARDERWISNGCVRVEDARRLAAWLFGEMPRGRDPLVEEDVELARPVPVYITYMTAEAGPGGVVFRKDPYGRDALLMQRYAASARGAGRSS